MYHLDNTAKDDVLVLQGLVYGLCSLPGATDGSAEQCLCALSAESLGEPLRPPGNLSSLAHHRQAESHTRQVLVVVQ